MKKVMNKVWAAAVLAGALLVAGTPRPASAEVSVNINLGPPPIVIAEPPELVLVPDLQVYFVPHPEIDVFFHDGYWWSPRGNTWYRARAYNGPWGVVERRHIPAAVARMPHDYRGRYEKERHIPYGQWKKQGGHPGGKKQKHGRDHGRNHN